MSFFSNAHVLQAGLQGSMGPPVGITELTEQKFQQQWHVDSARALDDELRTRWLESLHALQLSGQNFSPPTGINMYRDFARFVHDGTPVVESPYGSGAAFTPYSGGAPTRLHSSPTEFEEMRRANEAIRQLNNPNVKTFEQILAETSAMQREVEQRTASMSERASGFANVVGMLGSIAGSFTIRDPLNIVTAPIGGGRTIAMKIFTDMAVAGLTTATTELTDVQPNRALAGLPERNPYYDIAAATIGAGLLRGGIEGLGAGFRSLGRQVDAGISFDFRDIQLQHMFTQLEQNPRARAALSFLDDAAVFEHSNPYGDGHVAGYRWQAELDSTTRALNGEPEPAVEMPPVPNEFVERQLSFQLVKENAPELWDELEVARTQLAEVDNNIAEASSRELSIPDAVRLVDEKAGARLDQLEAVVNDLTLPEPVRVAADTEAQSIVLRTGANKIMRAVEQTDTKARYEVQNLRATRKAANKQYRAAYQKVEAEAARLEHTEAAKRATAQVHSIDVLGPDIVTEPMTGPMTRQDFVEAHDARVSEAEAALPAKTDAVNDLQIDPEMDTVDIGSKTPVSADFKVPFDEGELSVREVLDDLAEDQRLEEAVKGCAI